MTSTKLRSERLGIADVSAVQELFHNRGWTDGLPVVPPTPDAVQACLDWALMSPEQVIGVEPVRQQAITAEKVAVNAVMAGCLPMHVPLVVAAVTAVLNEDFLVHGATASTGGCGILLIVNGPVRAQTGMQSTFNALGPSDRASTVVGRAIRLILNNLLDVRAGGIDRSTLGHPGKISFCIAEDEEGSRWPSLAAERLGDPHVSAVTAMAAMAPRQVMNEWTTDPEEILDTFVAEIKANMAHYSIWSGNYAIVIPPQLRQHFNSTRWSKTDIRNYVFEHARIRRSAWAECGKANVVADKGDHEYCALPDPDHLLVIAAGRACVAVFDGVAAGSVGFCGRNRGVESGGEGTLSETELGIDAYGSSPVVAHHRFHSTVNSPRLQLLAVALEVVETTNPVAIGFGDSYRMSDMGGD